MRRAILLAGALAALAVPATAQAATSYCSPTGDFCYSAERRAGVVRLRMDTFSLRGSVRVCVTRTGGQASCRAFRLSARRGGLYGFDRRWSAHFPHEGPGRYRVRFSQADLRIGPGVEFRVRG